MSHVVLVEFAATDRFHRKGSFPYAFGWLKQQGVPTRWLRFGVAAARRFERGEEGLGLAPDELCTLKGALAGHGATHVLFGSRPAGSLLRGLRLVGAPSPRFAVFGETSGADEPALEAVDETVGGLAAFVGLDPPASEGPLHCQAVPDFVFEAANEAARVAPALPFMVLGRECTYSKPFARNPFLAGLDLENCLRRGGCAFCVRPAEGPGAWDLSPAEIREHLTALHRTLPSQVGRLAVRLLGEPALARLELLVEVVLDVGFRDADWLLDARADALVALSDRLAGAAARFDGTGNRLHVALVGIESFSAAELDRLNKGTDPLTNLAAVTTLLDLERSCAGTFAFREHGGLSLILFTPWTTRADLAANLRLLQVTGLEPLCGKVFTSRLRLAPGLPLTERARLDGLVQDGYDDPLLDTAARNLYDPEIPWRFGEPALEPVCRLLLRFPGTAPPDDPLAEPVRRALSRAREAGLTPLDVAVRLVDLAVDGEPPLALLARGEAWVGEVASERDATRRGERWADTTPDASGELPLALRLAVGLSERGVKPVSKLEPLSGPQAAELAASGALPNARVRPRRVGQTEAAVHEVFFGADPARVAAAVAATDRLEHPESDEAEADAVAAAGRLLGYPACCAEAFSAARSSGRWSYAWLHLRRRVETPGVVAWQSNPWAASLLTSHVPCSLACERSLELASASAVLFRDVAGPEALARVEEQARRPWLASLEGQGAGLELLPEDPPGERFRYRCGTCSDAASPDLALAAGGDELILEPLRLVVLKAGRLHADLSMRAYVWWSERGLQVEGWRRVLAIREGMVSAPGPGAAGRDAADEPDIAKASPRLLKLRQLVLLALPARGAGTLAGFEAEPPRVISHGRLRLVLARGATRVLLDVEEARAEHCWRRVGPIALTFPGDTPLPDGPALAAVQALVLRLEAVLRAAGERMLRGR